MAALPRAPLCPARAFRRQCRGNRCDIIHRLVVGGPGPLAPGARAELLQGRLRDTLLEELPSRLRVVAELEQAVCAEDQQCVNARPQAVGGDLWLRGDAALRSRRGAERARQRQSRPFLALGKDAHRARVLAQLPDLTPALPHAFGLILIVRTVVPCQRSYREGRRVPLPVRGQDRTRVTHVGDEQPGLASTGALALARLVVRRAGQIQHQRQCHCGAAVLSVKGLLQQAGLRLTECLSQRFLRLQEQGTLAEEALRQEATGKCRAVVACRAMSIEDSVEGDVATMHERVPRRAEVILVGH
mmetsp:Transcript_39468/g.102144  ORF Transcript_39468/g.102144 Transcript_39468/m.102144 type:complete len:301 (-) Transcript_39468:1846-2748(-)